MTPPPKQGELFYLTRTLMRAMANEYRKLTKGERIFYAIVIVIIWALTGFDGA